MDFEVPPEWAEFADSLVRFVQREVVPLETEHKRLFSSERYLFGEDGRFSPELLELRRHVRMRSAELGFYTAFALESLGGGGLGAQASAYVQRRLNAFAGPGRRLIQTVVLPSAFTNGLSPLLRHLEPEVLSEYLDEIANGSKTLCFGLSEPDAGSDIFAMRTRATPKDGGWVLNGTKQWITNAPYADYAMIFAVTDAENARSRRGGVTGFFVPMRTSGVEVTGVIPIMGHLGTDLGIIHLQDVFVPDSHRIGEVDEGVKVALGGVQVGRLGVAGSCLGLACWALDQAVQYARVRKAFDRPIGELQSVQNMLAECALDIYATSSLIQNCAWLVDESKPCRMQVSLAKVASTEAAGRVLDRCIQVHGAMGLSNELRLEEGYRFVRSMRIPDGTSDPSQDHRKSSPRRRCLAVNPASSALALRSKVASSPATGCQPRANACKA